MQERSRPLLALAAIAALEGIGLVAYAVYEIVQAVRIGATGPADVSSGPVILMEIALFALFGAGMLWVARGWLIPRRWARAPFLLAQIFGLVIGVPLAQATGSVERVAGIALSLIAVLGIVLVFTPAVMRALEE